MFLFVRKGSPHLSCNWCKNKGFIHSTTPPGLAWGWTALFKRCNTSGAQTHGKEKILKEKQGLACSGVGKIRVIFYLLQIPTHEISLNEIVMPGILHTKWDQGHLPLASGFMGSCPSSGTTSVINLLKVELIHKRGLTHKTLHKITRSPIHVCGYGALPLFLQFKPSL